MQHAQAAFRPVVFQLAVSFASVVHVPAVLRGLPPSLISVGGLNVSVAPF
jgi:hypothetical protein